MAIKIDKALFDERVYGGFEPTDPDDETFLLDRIGTYPGKLPYDVSQTEEQENLEAFATEEPKAATAEQLSEQISSSEERATTEETPPETAEALAEAISPEQREPIPYQKAGIEETDKQQVPYEKAGVERETKVVTPYEKAGLIEEEAPVPFERKGAEKKDIKSIWDIFEEESAPQAEETTQEKAEEAEFPAEETTMEETREPIQEQAEPVLTSETEPSGEQTIVIESDSIVDIPLEIKVAEVSPEELSKILDDDFRNTLLQDLEKSKARKKEEKPAPEPIITQQEKEELQKELTQYDEFQQAPEEVTEIDISSMELERPSQIIAKELAETEEFKEPQKEKPKKKKEKKKKAKKEKAVAKEQAKEEAESQPEPTEEAEEEAKEEKKRRKVPVLWFFVLGGVLLLLFIIGGYLLYRGYFHQPEAKKEIVQKAKPKPTQKKVESPAETPPQPPQETKPTEQPKQVEKPKPEPVARKEETPMPKLPVAKPKEQTEKKAPPPEPKVPKPEAQKPTIAKKEIEPTKQAAQKPIKLPQEVKIVETPQAEYSIEIFSTADKEEAAYWLDQLQRRGINAFKKIQRIRNVDYYKIRIGLYKTAEEAKAVARALGFKNVWIDRVK
jgi:hypothetical protein